MAIVGIGVDVVNLTTFAARVERAPRLLDRLFSEDEQADVSGDLTRLAAKAALKEATLKALGAAPTISWHDIATDHLPTGAPTVSLSGTALALAEARQVGEILCSVSHDAPIATAFVILQETPSATPIGVGDCS